MLRYSGERFIMNDVNGKSHLVKQVSAPMAKKAYENNEPIWMHPCMMRVDNMWQKPMPTSKKQVEDNAFTSGSTFESIVNDFRYYNCDNERGKYPIYFIPAA